MCGPMMGMLSGVMSGISSMMAGQNQAKSLEMQAQFNKRQAVAEGYSGGYEAYKLERQGERMVGAQDAAFGKAGIEGGSPGEVRIATKSELDMDKQAILFGSDLKSSNYRYKAEMDLVNADQARQGGMLGMLGGFISAGTKLSSTFA